MVDCNKYNTLNKQDNSKDEMGDFNDKVIRGTLSSSSRELSSYLNNWNIGMLKKPKFQRNAVWGNEKKYKLIESIILGYPVPPVFLYKKDLDTDTAEIIDGYQRISTIIGYLNDEFKLKNTSTEYNDSFFSELSDLDKQKITNKTIDASIITGGNERFIFNLFHRLNTGSVLLNPMEIRRCSFNGELLKMLERLNKYSNWRKIWSDAGKEDNRFKDLDLILRVLALYTSLKSKVDFSGNEINEISFNTNDGNIKNYTGGFKSFLNEFFAEFQSNSFEDFEDRFKRCCDFIVDKVDSNYFKVNSKSINYILFDSIFTFLLLLDYRKRLNSLHNFNNTYNEIKKLDIISQKGSTESLSKILLRLNEVQKIIIRDFK